tara:strand:+ start:1357 stop:2373 length:1017 start_codon:yes stop_codon:yes gene_type:complete
MINKKKKLLNNLLVVGAGSIGKRHIANNLKFFENIDIADTREDRIKECQQKFKINLVFKDFNVALKKKKYDAVFITTPPHLHLKIAKLAVKNKSHILIEKPLGMNTKGWDNVSKICKKNKLVNYIAYCHRHINYTKKFKKFLTEKKIGKLLNGNLTWGSYFPDWHPWEKYWTYYMAKKKQGGGALMDESHGIDLIRYFFGEPKKIVAFVDKISNLNITADDNAFLLFKMKNRMLINLNFDIISKPTKCYLQINGSKGSLVWDRVNHEIKFYSDKKKKWSIFKYSKSDYLKMYKTQANYFIDCIKKRRKSNIDINDAIKTQKIIDKSFKSQKKGKLIYN